MKKEVFYYVKRQIVKQANNSNSSYGNRTASNYTRSPCVRRRKPYKIIRVPRTLLVLSSYATPFPVRTYEGTNLLSMCI